MLFDAILLDPLNIFLYTWTFLEVLECQETNLILNKVYHWYRILSIWLMPLFFLGLFTCEVLVKGKIADVKAESFSES